MAAGKTNIGGSGLRIKRIQRGTFTATSTSGNYVTVDAVDPKYSIVQYQTKGIGKVNEASKFDVQFESPTKLSFNRHYGSSGVEVAWTLVELDPTSVRRVQVIDGGIVVQRYPPSSKDFDISPVDLNKTVLFFTWSDDYGDNVAHNFTLTFWNSFTLRAEAWYASHTVTFRAYVIETY